MNEQRPYPTTVYGMHRAKVSDGKSVSVPVPQNTTIVAQQPYLLGGFFGFAMANVTTGAGETSEVILNIEQAEFETDTIVTTESFPIGAKVYWDDTAKKITTTEGTNRAVGRVSQAKDAKNVIWMILGPQN